MAPSPYAFTKHRVIVSILSRSICDSHGHKKNNMCDDVAAPIPNDELHTLGDVRAAIANRLGIDPDEFTFRDDFYRPQDESTLPLKYLYADVKRDYVLRGQFQGLPTVLLYIDKNDEYKGGMLERVLDYVQVGNCANYDKKKGSQLAKRFRTIIAALKAEDAKQALEKQEAVQDTG